MTDSQPSGRAVVRRLARRVLAHGVAANMVGTFAVAFIIVIYNNIYTGGLSPSRRLGSIAIIAFGVLAVCITAAIPMTRIVAERSARWLIEGRTPDADDLKRFASIPRQTALVSVGFWGVGTAVVFPLYTLVAGYRIETGARQVVATLISFAYGALVGAFLSYLLAERELRPILSSVLEAQPERWPPSTGVSGRLILAWLAVAGAPLIMLGYYAQGITSRPPPTASLKDFLPQIGIALMSSCALAVVVGLAVFVYAGRAITAPIGRVQQGLRRVTEGDLSVRVEVGEGGEIGLLQAGFNEMVAGLRERERMREVFGRHVGTDVARLAMEGDFGSGGRQCEATAMFVDVIGSTALAQRQDPDAVVETLNRFFDAVVRSVASAGGFVNKFQGDGALCVFGAPVPQGDHAARGLRAARALALELSTLTDITAAIGVSSGTVVAGNVGTVDRYEFTVIGDPVNEAARLTEEAKLHPSRVLASDRTIQAAGSAAEGWIRGEAIALRGRTQPTITYSPYD